ASQLRQGVRIATYDRVEWNGVAAASYTVGDTRLGQFRAVDADEDKCELVSFCFCLGHETYWIMARGRCFYREVASFAEQANAFSRCTPRAWRSSRWPSTNGS